MEKNFKLTTEFTLQSTQFSVCNISLPVHGWFFFFFILLNLTFIPWKLPETNNTLV